MDPWSVLVVRMVASVCVCVHLEWSSVVQQCSRCVQGSRSWQLQTLQSIPANPPMPGSSLPWPPYAHTSSQPIPTQLGLSENLQSLWSPAEVHPKLEIRTSMIKAGIVHISPVSSCQKSVKNLQSSKQQSKLLSQDHSAKSKNYTFQ